MTETSVSIDIVESCVQTGPGSCSLEWSLVDEDNDDPECYLIGTSHLIRLYESPETLTVQTFNSNGSVNYVEDITEDIEDEYVVFSGEQTSDLAKVMHSGFSSVLIGNAYGVNGEVLSSVTFTIQKGTKQILASVPCYAIIKVSYVSMYSSYSFSANSEGKILLVAIATCESNNNEQVIDTIDIDLWETCKDDPTVDRCLDIEIKVDTSSDEGSSYDNQGKKLIKVWGATISQITYGATLGSVTFLGSVDETVEEEIAGCGEDDFNTTNRVHSIISQSTISGNLNSFIVEDGELKMLSGGDPVGGIPKGYGTLKIKYVTRCLKFLIESSREGKGVFIVDDNTFEECGITCQEYELGEDTKKEELYDITVIYKDFVTGAPIGEARVWVDNKYIGQTNADGEIDVEQISAGKKHLIKASKPGYLNTDSDSLTNDSFIIPED